MADASSNICVSIILGSSLEASPTPNQHAAQPNPSLVPSLRSYVYLHPNDKYHPSSVDRFFSNGALLYNKEDESKPVRIGRDKVRCRDIASAEAYILFKPAVLNGTFTDIQVHGFINKLPLGKVGEHVGDWEHVTLRVRNVDGVLDRVYFSQHTGGKWVNASELQFQNQTEKMFAWYSSRNGHAGNNEEGLFLQGPAGNDVGIRNDWAKSDKMVDTEARFVVVASEGEAVVEL
ncbi:hypothetical protein SASPL_153010 [Salvia splendens]|uniref:Uncharacterized protein n=1 Tax=Salvia splendens TaxID=180675 RepID=A0A8X8W4D2_SALSN|nr:hypothetical protein SASPL_153010 [Salvia splendens]